MAFIGTKLIAGENVKFIANEDGDLVLNAYGDGAYGGGSSEYVQGYFNNTNLAARTYKQLGITMTRGDSNLISGNELVVPEDGLYVFSYAQIVMPNSGDTTFAITKNSMYGDDYKSRVLSVNAHGYTFISGSSRFVYLNKGDTLSCSIWSSVAQANITRGGDFQIDFTFTRIGSGK